MTRRSPKLSDIMQLALARITTQGAKGTAPNTMAALRRRGLIERDPKNGFPFVTVTGYHAIGRKHPHEC